MPVQFSKNITKDLKISVWNITEEPDELLGELKLSTNEEIELDQIHHIKGKKQWLAARNLIKSSLNFQHHVVYNELGVPFLNGQDTNISLSHSGNKVALACNSIQATGIDIQLYSEKIFRIAPKFLNEFEIDWLENQTNKGAYLHLLWNFKESLFKYYTSKMPFKSVEVQPFDLHDEGWVKAVRKLTKYPDNFLLRYHIFEDYYLGYLVEQI